MSEKIPNPFETEKPITLDEVMSKRASYGSCNREGWSQELWRGLSEHGWDEKKIDAVLDRLDIIRKMFGGRVPAHITRMFVRLDSPAEHEYAARWVQNPPDLSQIFSNADKKVIDNIRSTLGSEGLDTCMFWTFAPYVYRYLLSKSIEPDVAFKYLFEWAKYGHSMGSLVNTDINKVHLPLIREEFEGYEMPYVLNQDPGDITHEYTKRRAVDVGNWLIKEFKVLDETSR